MNSTDTELEKCLLKSLWEFTLCRLMENIYLIYILKTKLNFIAVIQLREKSLKIIYIVIFTPEFQPNRIYDLHLVDFCIIEVHKWQKVTF